MIKGNQRQWHSKFDLALQVDIISVKNIIKASPYASVYGIIHVLHIHMELSTMKILKELEDLELEPL